MMEEDLTYLLNESRTWNEEHNITGMLVYLQGRFITQMEGRFMQVLESTQEKVEYIFERIATDPRHHQIMVLKHDFVEHRYFKDWQMGFESVNIASRQNVKGFFPVNDSFLKHDVFNNSHVALDFLKSFYDTHKTFDF